MLKEDKNKKQLDKININLNSINSLYIFEAIISHLREKKKLEIFKFSKSFKNKLNRIILNYQLFIGIYKVPEKRKRKRICWENLYVFMIENT